MIARPNSTARLPDDFSTETARKDLRPVVFAFRRSSPTGAVSGHMAGTARAAPEVTTAVLRAHAQV